MGVGPYPSPMMQVFLLAVVAEMSLAQLILDGFESRQPRLQVQARRGKSLRTGRQQGDSAVSGGVDFTGCVTAPETGLCCVEKLEEITSIEKEPILECTHKNTEQCTIVPKETCNLKFTQPKQVPK